MYYTTQVQHVHAHVWLSGVLAVVVSVCKPVRGCFFPSGDCFFNHCSGVCGGSPGSVHLVICTCMCWPYHTTAGLKKDDMSDSASVHSSVHTPWLPEGG